MWSEIDTITAVYCLSILVVWKIDESTCNVSNFPYMFIGNHISRLWAEL